MLFCLLLPADKSFDELEKLVVEQVQPRKLAIAARYEFNQLKQGSDSVTNFIRKLRNAAEDCSFGAQLEDRIRDPFVFGTANIHAFKAMLIMKIEDLTLEKATNVALSARNNSRTKLECCTSCTSTTDGTSSAKAVYPVYKDGNDKRKASVVCHCCGKKGHYRADCQDCHFKAEKCHICGKVGHLKNICQSSS